MQGRKNRLIIRHHKASAHVAVVLQPIQRRKELLRQMLYTLDALEKKMDALDYLRSLRYPLETKKRTRLYRGLCFFHT